MEEKSFKAGYCTIVGIPNAGKSTLLNALLGTKLSIISHKPQTTRKRVLGIYSSPESQIIFLDTPGIMPKPSTLHHKALLEEVRTSFNDADVILALAEADRRIEKALPREWTNYVELAGGKPIILGLSKVDLVKEKESLLPLLAEYGAMPEFKEIVPFSSTKRHNTKRLLSVITSYLPEGKPYYDTEQLSDQNERFFVSELIREAIFHRYRDEIPYSTEVIIEEYAEREAGKWFISAQILVERDSQKGILIGDKGAALKALGAAARKEIERFIGHNVFLELRVKTREDWRNDQRMLKSLGYQF
jgi:GTP-binding protein Era